LIQKTCLEIADERKLLLALISDTGMRLSEALGLVLHEVADHITIDARFLALVDPGRKLGALKSSKILVAV
tara:strand:- start:146 stop:358 length:213 start_codon:yes stop_codon:yes gene_type:complete